MPLNFDPNQNCYLFNKKDTVPLVFIHGVGLDHQMWGHQISYFNEYSTLTYDLLGHGKTPWNKNKLTLKDFSNQLFKLLYHLKIEKVNLNRAGVVWGSGIGGMKTFQEFHLLISPSAC